MTNRLCQIACPLPGSPLTELFDKLRGEDPRRKRSSKYGGELAVEAPDAHLVKVPLGVDDRLVRLLPDKRITARHLSKIYLTAPFSQLILHAYTCGVTLGSGCLAGGLVSLALSALSLRSHRVLYCK